MHVRLTSLSLSRPRFSKAAMYSTEWLLFSYLSRPALKRQLMEPSKPRASDQCLPARAGLGAAAAMMRSLGLLGLQLSW